MTKFKFYWSLFDGEGGEGNASSGSQSGLGAEADEFLASLGGGERTDNNDTTESPEVAYGIDTEASDNSASESESQEEISPEEEFAELVGKNGRFHDLYGKAVSDAIDKRFKNQSSAQERVDSYEDALAPLMRHYGLERGDIEGLTEAINSDDDWIEDAAREKGITPDQYRENLRLQEELEKNQRALSEYKAEAKKAEQMTAWNAEADELRESFPNFDLEQEMNYNPKFTDLIENGISVIDAFVATHTQDILKGLTEESTRSAKQDVVNQIQQRQSRPVENGLKHQPAVTRKVNPSEFTNEDMDKILKDVENGKTFSF
jgi:hypothetical protein